MNRIVVYCRTVWRLLALGGVFVAADFDYRLGGGKKWSAPRKAQWLTRWSAAALRQLGAQVDIEGVAPKGGLITANHLSYIDILVLASVTPQVFLSKSEVAAWPLIGSYTRMAGTLYIDRKRRQDVATKEEAFTRVIDSGLGLAVFLEGTSSDGREVLPFRSSLLEPAARNGWPATPAYLQYECEGGDPAYDVCWWGDMPFFSHLMKLLGLSRIRASVSFAEPIGPIADRKQYAHDLHAKVLELRAKKSRLD